MRPSWRGTNDGDVFHPDVAAPAGRARRLGTRPARGRVPPTAQAPVAARQARLRRANRRTVGLLDVLAERWGLAQLEQARDRLSSAADWAALLAGLQAPQERPADP